MSPDIAKIAALRRDRGCPVSAAAMAMNIITGSAASSSLPTPKKREPNFGLGPSSERTIRCESLARSIEYRASAVKIGITGP